MMARTTPGLDFLAYSFLKPTVYFLTILLVDRVLDIRLSTSILLFAPVFAISGHIAIWVLLEKWGQQIESTRLGARLAPRIQRNPREQIDIFGFLADQWKTGFCARKPWGMPVEGGFVANIRMLWTDTIVTNAPEHVKLIVSTNSDNYVKGDDFRNATSSILGTGVFNTDGSMWKFHRSVTRPFFSQPRRDTHVKLCDRHAENIIAQIGLHHDADCQVDFRDLLCRSTLNSATELLFGTCVSSLPYPCDAHPNHESSAPAMDFSAAILRVQEIISARENLGWIWPLFEISGDRTKEPMSVICRSLDPIIRRAMGLKMMRSTGVTYHMTDDNVKGQSDQKYSETLLDQLVELTDELYQIKEVILNVLIAGQNNVASTLMSIVYFLALHPNVTSRLQQEILTFVGATRGPERSNLKKMVFLRAVINETLRLAPPVSHTIRESVASTTWPSLDYKEKPIFIPARSKISYNVLSIHTSKRLWGPDADLFDPDRFLDERSTEYLAPNPYIFIPFGAGVRSCFGNEFAYDEISVLVVRLLQSYGEISLDPSSSFWPTTHGRSLSENMGPRVRFFAYSNGNELRIKLEDATC